MKERPILFSAPMVLAILAGVKTQTRRIFKAKNGAVWPNRNDLPGMRQLLRTCPYGQKGDRLWVREAWHTVDGDHVFYRADYAHDPAGDREHGIRWKPSIHMPRAASRILLEIVSVRVERLQEISEVDALYEGAVRDKSVGPFGGYVSGYRDLWESINGPGSWAANPWVWVVEFRRLP